MFEVLNWDLKLQVGVAAAADADAGVASVGCARAISQSRRRLRYLTDSLFNELPSILSVATVATVAAVEAAAAFWVP